MSTNNHANIRYTKRVKEIKLQRITHPDDLEEHRLNEEKLISKKRSFISRKIYQKKKQQLYGQTYLFLV
jgi:hypothetical protein